MKKSKTKNSRSGGVGRCDVVCTAWPVTRERADSTTLQLAAEDTCQFDTNLLWVVREQHACQRHERVTQHEKANGHSDRR
jgi:hypothetical protein